MSGPLVGAARVEIVGDLDKFAGGAQQKIGAAMGHIEGEVDQGLHNITAESEAAGSKAGAGWASKAGDKIKTGLGHVKSAAGGILGDLGIGATLAAAVGSALSTSQNRGKLAATLGLSPADAKKYGSVAGNIYAGAWGDSLDEVDDSLAAVKRGLGDLPVGQMQDVTTEAMAFKSAFGYEATDSIRAVSNMLRTGLAKNAKEAFDVLTAGEQAGTDKAGDLMDTFNEYSVQFHKFGLSGADALGLLQQGLQAGARDSDLVADSIKEFSLRAVDGSTGTAAAFKSLGLDAGRMSHLIAAGGEAGKAGLQGTLDALRAVKDPVKQAQLAAQLFGSQAEDLGGALYALNPATASAAKGLGQVTGAGDKMTENMGKTTPPLEALKRSAMGTFSELAAKAIPVLTPIMGMMTKLGPEIVAVGLALAGMMVVTKVASVISSFGQVLAPMAARMGIMTAATEAETVAQTELNLAFLANPIVLIIAGLALLGAAFVLLWKKSETFRDIVRAVFHGIAVAAQATWGAIKAVLTWIGNAAVGLWHSLQGVGDGIKAVWHLISWWLHFEWTVISKIFGWIKSGLQGVKTFVGRVVGGFWGGLTDGIQAAWRVIQRILGWIEQRIQDVKDKINALNPFKGIDAGSVVNKLSPAQRKQLGLPGNERGGDIPLGWSTSGENGIEYIYNSGSRQTVYTKDSTNAMPDKVGRGEGVTAELVAALLAVAERPQVHYLRLPDKRVIAVAAEEGSMLLDRAR